MPWCVPWSSDAEASAKKVSAGPGLTDSRASAGPLVSEEKVTLRASKGGAGGQFWNVSALVCRQCKSYYIGDF